MALVFCICLRRAPAVHYTRLWAQFHNHYRVAPLLSFSSFFFFYVSGRNQPRWSSLSSPPCNQHGGGQDRLLHRAGCHAGYGRVRRSGGHLQLCQDPLLQTYQHDPDWSEWERPQALWPAECGSRSVAAPLSLCLCVGPFSLMSSVAVYPLLMKKRDLTYNFF